jgi:hypothetical protein
MIHVENSKRSRTGAEVFVEAEVEWDHTCVKPHERWTKQRIGLRTLKR